MKHFQFKIDYVDNKKRLSEPNRSVTSAADTVSEFKQQSRYISAVPRHQLTQLYAEVTWMEYHWILITRHTVQHRVCLTAAIADRSGGARWRTGATVRLVVMTTSGERRAEEFAHDLHTAHSATGQRPVIHRSPHQPSHHLQQTSHTYFNLPTNSMAVSRKFDSVSLMTGRSSWCM